MSVIFYYFIDVSTELHQAVEINHIFQSRDRRLYNRISKPIDVSASTSASGLFSESVMSSVVNDTDCKILCYFHRLCFDGGMWLTVDVLVHGMSNKDISLSPSKAALHSFTNLHF